MSIPMVEGRRFKVGKYEVVGKPIPESAHMLRYTVFVDGIRIGALASVPTESDCLFLEKPPAVPPLKIYSVIYRPGRPKKGTVRAIDKAPPVPPVELPDEIALPRLRDAD
jgi:hypothetical protein